MSEKLYRSYSLEQAKNSDNEVITSGSLKIWEDTPVSPFNVGDTFRPVNGSPALTVEKISIRDNVIGEQSGKTLRQWEVTIEGSNNHTSGTSSNTHVKYNFEIKSDEKTGTMEVINTGSQPSISLNVGDKFTVPGIGEISCVSVRGNDDYDENGVHKWTVIYEGSNAQTASDEDFVLPSEEITDITHELNGLTARTISGELIVLQRSENPITRKTIVAYSNNANPMYTIGSTYNGGIALSEKIIKETKEIRKANGEVEESTYYRHEIEVEA